MRNGNVENVRLHRGVLGLLDIAAATMANIGPAMSFYFGFAFIAETAGVASPLVILMAGIAIALLGNTLSEFTKVLPSTGGFITFVGKTFGGRIGVTTALLTGAGYITAMASVTAIVGGFFQFFLQYYNWPLKNTPWIIWTLLFLAIAIVLMVRGVHISTKVAGFFFAIEMVIMFIVATAAMIKYSGNINFAPLNPSNLSLSTLAPGFPLAIYLFIGWENSAALAEETENPRRNVPRAVYTSVLIMTVAYLYFAYATVIGFGGDITKLGAAAASIGSPFLGVAFGISSVLLAFAFIAGFTSTMGALIAGTNSQARLLFNAGREGLLPAWVGRVDSKRRTPINALLMFLAVGMVIIGGWGLLHILGGSNSGSMSAFAFFGYSGTFGTILVLVVYALANIALPFYMKRHHANKFNGFRHAALPIVGVAVIALPLYYLAKPGQPQPFNWYPYAALVAIVVSFIYASVLVAKDKTVGDRVGSLVADEDLVK
ncbi:MAG: APC family permease [Actinomycetota bacterium]